MVSSKGVSPVVSRSKTTISELMLLSSMPTKTGLPFTMFISTPGISFIPAFLAQAKASGNACTQPLSVIAMALCPIFFAYFIKSLADTVASIKLI